MKLSRLHWAILIAATAVLVATAPSEREDDIAKPSKLAPPRPTAILAKQSAGVGRVELERLSQIAPQPGDKKMVGDAFNVTSWYVPPPAPRVVAKPVEVEIAPPAPPAAPPLPFVYLGRYGDTAARTIILSKGDRIYTVAVGDIIENSYRVEKFTQGAVHLTYLPLNIEQTLRTGEAL
jgi:hypothetical protein